MIKSKKTQGKFSALRTELANKDEQLAGLQGMVDRLNEKSMASMKRLMSAWRNKSLLTTFAAWKGYAKEATGMKMRMRKFLMKMKNAGMCKCFMNWATFVDECKRER